MGRLMLGSTSFGPNPLEALGSGRLTGGVGLEPKVPIGFTNTKGSFLSLISFLLVIKYHPTFL